MSADNHSHSKRNWGIVVAVGVGIALFITLFSPFASSSPDGLNAVAEDKGFGEQAQGPTYEVIAGYSFPGVTNERAARVISGIVGVLIVAALGLGIGYGMKLLARSRTDAPNDLQARRSPISGQSGG